MLRWREYRKGAVAPKQTNIEMPSSRRHLDGFRVGETTACLHRIMATACNVFSPTYRVAHVTSHQTLILSEVTVVASKSTPSRQVPCSCSPRHLLSGDLSLELMTFHMQLYVVAVQTYTRLDTYLAGLESLRWYFLADVILPLRRYTFYLHVLTQVNGAKSAYQVESSDKM